MGGMAPEIALDQHRRLDGGISSCRITGTERADDHLEFLVGRDDHGGGIVGKRHDRIVASA